MSGQPFDAPVLQRFAKDPAFFDFEPFLLDRRLFDYTAFRPKR